MEYGGWNKTWSGGSREAHTCQHGLSYYPTSHSHHLRQPTPPRSASEELSLKGSARSGHRGSGRGTPGSSQSIGASSFDSMQAEPYLDQPTAPQQTPTVVGDPARIYRQLMGLSNGPPAPPVYPGYGGYRLEDGSPNQPGSPAFIRAMELSRAKLKATSRTSALLSGFAMVALVELDYGHVTRTQTVPLLIPFGIVTTLLVSVHLLALMMSTCILPHLETSSDRDSPHVKLKWYIEVSWFFSTCLGLLLFLLEIGIIFWIKFMEAGYPLAAYVTTGLLVPVFVLFILFTYNFYKNLMMHRVEHMTTQLGQLHDLFQELERGEIPSRPQHHSSMIPLHPHPKAPSSNTITFHNI